MIVETNGLSYMFGHRHAIQDVNLRVPDGAAMALVGANGAGKTTLLRLLVNILHPTSGSARLLGRDTQRLGLQELQQIGYASENQALPQRLTVAAYFDYLRPLYERWDRVLERRLSRDFELPLHQRIDRLSHGTCMKLKLTAVLAFRPALLLLDEPLGGLDPAVRDEVLGGLIDRAGDTTILVATHEMTEIEGFATHVAFMADGELHFQDELGNLAGRIRDVRVQLGAHCDLPRDLPKSWFRPTLSGRILGFTDCDFVSDAVLKRQLETIGFAISGLGVRPLSLREIAIVMMRSPRGGGVA
jgi:ABC-2 type transport system ATP-binding protein